MNYKSTLLKIGSLIYNNNDSKVIYYHDVFENKMYTKMGTHLSLFTEHIKTLKDEKYNIVPKIGREKKEVQICFDDGFKGIYDLKDYFILNKIFPTIFIAIDLIGKKNYLDSSQIKELHNSGFIIQSHTWSHKDLTTFSDKDLNREIIDSKHFLEDLISDEVSEICFPIGYFNNDVISKSISTGYKSLFSSIPGTANEKFKTKVSYRNNVQHSNCNDFKSILRGGLFPFKSRYIKMHFKNSEIQKQEFV